MQTEDKINILLVDDKPENLLALEAIIENDEYQLVKANSGEEALKHLMKYDFAAILLDVQMPGMDGFSTAKIIKAREKTKHIPILFITANYLDAEHIFMGYSVGAIDYIMKPFNPLILKAKVEGFVEIYKIKKKLMEQASELSERNQVIQYMAYHDSLTDLANRRMFNEQLHLQINHSKKWNRTLAVMYLDLDRFKYINDSLGHIIGDRMLQEVASRLKAHVREGDLVARVGGDEFTILLPETNRENALEVAENLLIMFKEPFYLDNYELFISTCIGLSIFPYDGEDAVTLVKNADAALYRAKEQGKNKFKIFHSGMNLHSYRTYLIQQDLRKAIKNEELELVYQPKMDLHSGKVTSAEALLRWRHPNWGIVSPLEFIPIAEESGQIVDIGKWVLLKVCQQLKAWKDRNIPPVRVAINLSPQSFSQKDLVKHFKEVLSITNVEAKLLEIEITESVILGKEEIIIQTLKELRKLGITITLDDFGTGYSSLSYIRHFPFDFIKIDRTFIQDISTHVNESKAIIEAVTAIAKNLNMSVVAEGVETEEQLSIVSQYPCQYVQGYIFSPPLPLIDFEKVLTGETVISYNSKRNAVNSKVNPTNYQLSEDKDLKQEFLEMTISRMAEVFSISSRETDVFKLMISGLTNKEISEQLFISEHTVKNHITRILQKLNVTDRVQAISLVYESSINERNYFN